MKLNWKYGHEREYLLGANIRGLKHEGARPETVTLTQKELALILRGPGHLWATKILLPSLKSPE